MRDPNRAKSSLDLRDGRALSWMSGTAGAVAVVLIGIGFNVLGYSPPSFGLARLCFVVSTLLLMAAVGIAVLRLDAPPTILAAMACLVFVAGVAVMLAALLWAAWRESDFISHRPPSTVANTATQSTAQATTAPAAPQPVSPSATHTAVDTAAPSENFRPHTGSREDPFTNVNIWKITEPYNSRTEVEADAITQRYIGRWLQLDSKVHNVSSSSSVSQHDFMVGFSVEEKPSEQVTVLARFTDTKSPAVKFFHRDDHVVVLGRIDRVAFRALVLDKCELISP